MEHTNEFNENQTSVSETVSTTQAEKDQTDLLGKDLEAFKQQFLTEMDAKLEQKLSQLIPKPVEKATTPVETVVTDEITILKNKIEQMEKLQQSLLHHDLGSGQINSNQSIQRTKTLQQLIEERTMRG